MSGGGIVDNDFVGGGVDQGGDFCIDLLWCVDLIFVLVVDQVVVLLLGGDIGECGGGGFGECVE